MMPALTVKAAKAPASITHAPRDVSPAAFARRVPARKKRRGLFIAQLLSSTDLTRAQCRAVIARALSAIKRPTDMLNANQVERYRRDGYLFPIPALSPDETAESLAGLERF